MIWVLNLFFGGFGGTSTHFGYVVGNKINKLRKQKYFRGIQTQPLGPLTEGVSVCKGGGVWLEANKKLGGGGKKR